ncbi:hypothetical protein, partial [Arthrobacter alpinus]|uniref:hypothetical protein n=1 Tax=Arthrobacter alpinus TaxID=656366 RepID=UPI001C948CFF
LRANPIDLTAAVVSGEATNLWWTGDLDDELYSSRLYGVLLAAGSCETSLYAARVAGRGGRVHPISGPEICAGTLVRLRRRR